MAPGKWDDEESDSTPPSSPPAIARRKFDDEEDDSDLLDSWDAAEDSETERAKAKKAEEEKAKAEAERKAKRKPVAVRVEERKREAEELRRRLAEDQESSTEEEDDVDEKTRNARKEAKRIARQREQEKLADYNNAVDLFGDIGVSDNRAVKPIVVSESNDPTSAIDLSALPLFKPKTKDQFSKLRETLTPLLVSNSKAPQYSLFLQEFTKAIAKDLPSEQIKKLASGLTTLSNEKMREEKAAEKGGKKSKAAKTKTSLVASRDVSTRADTMSYEDDFGDDDFM